MHLRQKSTIHSQLIRPIPNQNFAPNSKVNSGKLTKNKVETQKSQKSTVIFQNTPAGQNLTITLKIRIEIINPCQQQMT